MPSPEVIEHARGVKNIPADWAYAMCMNDCGEVVFYPETARAEAEVRGPIVVVCSAKCAREKMDKL